MSDHRFSLFLNLKLCSATILLPCYFTRTLEKDNIEVLVPTNYLVIPTLGYPGLGCSNWGISFILDFSSNLPEEKEGQKK